MLKRSSEGLKASGSDRVARTVLTTQGNLGAMAGDERLSSRDGSPGCPSTRAQVETVLPAKTRSLFQRVRRRVQGRVATQDIRET